MTGRGRPLRFVATVAAAWAGMRVVLLWPEGASLPQAIEAAFPLRPARAASVTPRPAHPVRTAGPAGREVAPLWSPPSAKPVAILVPNPSRSFAMLGLVSFGAEQAIDPPPGVLPRTGPVRRATLPDAARPDRWSASAWFVTRGGGTAGGTMLGGDQAGVRVAYTLDRAQRVAVYARASGPLSGTGREVALGVEWRPFRAPLRFLAEHRIALDGGASGSALGIVAGVDRVDLPFAFELEAYGQAGAVARDRIEPFADGAARITREIASSGTARVALGAGTWGAAQRDAARLDIGPTAVATLPLGGPTVRVAVDWRERVAGDARPGSGPALSIGADF
ncbi:hypothetical protein ABS767_05365 [Sphingomonas sp. ST-64]|uniref:Haemolysin activator HlyB C-terminal domain-containing protein n=1 Tax=Sphingomonas plantiphila TaxID=3163295 RepID=A0ABW8YKC8_9SPHN